MLLEVRFNKNDAQTRAYTRLDSPWRLRCMMIFTKQKTRTKRFGCEKNTIIQCWFRTIFIFYFYFFFSRQYVFQLPFIFVLWITIIYLFVLFFMFVAATAHQKRNLFAFFPPPLNSFVCERCFQQKICWNRSFWVIWLNTVKKIPSLNEYLTDFCHFFIMSKEKNLVQFLSPANS